MSDVYRFILSLRAIRDYQDRPIDPDDLESILEAARWTGSSKNRQDWSFLVVSDRERLTGLAEHGDFTQPVRNSATTLVLVQEPGGHPFDMGRVAQNIMLAARAVGVASCPITLHRSDDARAYLGLDDNLVTEYAIALGYPAPDAEPRKFGGRKDKETLVRMDEGNSRPA